jgi:2-polyprenyl-3-methyl-5-hydroxy-6-metoxy-1,4-benzoquinol methylase
MNTLSDQLTEEYRLRFSKGAAYRRKVWRLLVKEYFQDLVGNNKTVFDLGCGWGEFINHVSAQTKYAMDLNPDAKDHLSQDVLFINQSCSEPWNLDNESIDIVFTSNFLEHLFNKGDVVKTVSEAFRCLKPGGLIICLGPNIKYTGGSYWDFFDHYIPLTEASIAELLTLTGFRVKTCIPKFLPYTMSDGKEAPLWCISWYLRMPFVWKLLGKQFLVVGRK